MQETLVVGGVAYPVKIIRELRNNSTASIGRKGVVIRLPLSLNREEDFRRLLKMKEWARKKLKEKPIRQKNKPLRAYKDGDTISVWDMTFLLKISEKDTQSSSARLRDDHIFFEVSSRLSDEEKQKYIITLLSRCLGQKMLPKLKEKIQDLNEGHFQQKINKISFKNASSRWGSCNSKGGNINISTRLFFAPEEVVEAVCVHELAHLIESNHSEQFWALVERAMPNYHEVHSWLKENGDQCGF